MQNLIPATIFLMFLLFGCSTAEKQPDKSEILPVKPGVIFNLDKDSAYFSVFIKGDDSVNSHLIKSINIIYLNIYNQEDLTDSFTFKDLTKKSTNGIKLFSRIALNLTEPLKSRLDYKSKPELLHDVQFEFVFANDNKKYSFIKKLSDILADESVSELSLEAIPFIDIKSDSTIDIGVDAVRKWENKLEYLPSSEIMRIEVFSEKGAKVWNSFEGLDYMQVISQVNPKGIGNLYRYSYEWDGRNFGGRKIARGNYKARIVIPTSPKPYFFELSFVWNR